MSEYNDGGLAERTGGSLSGGISQPGGPNTSSGSASNRNGSGSSSGGTYNDKSAGTNFGSIWSSYGKPYGITGFTTPRRDQTLQDRMFENLGGGMIGTDIGGRYTGGGGSGGQSGYGTNPAARRRQLALVNARRRTQGLPPLTTLPGWKPPVTGYPVDYMGAPPPYGIGFPDVTPNPLSSPPSWQDYGVQYGYTDSYTGQLPGGMMSPDDLDQGYMNDWANSGSGLNRPWGGQPVNSGNSFGGIGGIPGRAFGGSVAPGQTVTVGELGPEILTAGPAGGAQVQPLTYPTAPPTPPMKPQVRPPMRPPMDQGRFKIGAPNLARIQERRMAERAARKNALLKMRGLSA